MNTRNKQRGMTLVEIMVASSISLIVVTVGLNFVIQTQKTYQYETGKLLVNRDIRKFTLQMIDDATYANNFQIYDQISNLSRTSYSAVGSSDPTSATYQGYTADLAVTLPAVPVSTANPGTAKLDSGLPGDVLVLIYYVNGDNTKIWQLVIYYRVIDTPAGGTTGTNAAAASGRLAPLKRLVVSIPASAQSAGIMKLLPELTASTKGNTIFTYVDGQANDVVPTASTNRGNKMFYNLNDTSILVRGRIYENYTAQRIVKSTYNFTVTPRG
ncbi:MAG TPA: prepilin-type N-terminal cleavage/methylation domain-containing protein [Lacunisphaera sp.]|nr:prepilin-type N-terminal cleavage/methylation domain-containing protein [Lacunisphaera sp.]